MNRLHGKEMAVILTDDPSYYYYGRITVGSYATDKLASKITINYNLYSYKKMVWTTLGDWLWDPFNFETDMVTDTTFGNIEVDSEDWDEHDFTGLVDMMPVIPDFTVTGEVYAQLYNTDLKKNWTNVNKGAALHDGQIYDCILCEVTPESEIKMRFKGHGNVSLDFRSGRL
jgi:hypothetical protein